MTPATRRVRVTTREFEEPEERDYSTLPELEDDPEVDPDEDILRSIRERFGGKEYEVKVYRVTQGGKSFCFVDGPEITEESIRQHPYGGHGRFQLHVMINGELRRVEQISIEPPQAPAGTPGAVQGDTAVVRLLERIEARLFTQPQQAEPMSAVLGAVVNLINGQNQKPPETSLDQFLKIAQFVRETTGPSGDDASLTGILGGIAKQVAPVLLPGLMRGAVAGAPEGEQMGQQTEQLMLQQGIALLKKKCMIGSDPSLYLDFILDNADDIRFAKLVRLAATEQFEVFTRLDPEIARPPFRAYFEFIYNGLRSAFNAANKVGVDTGGQGGDREDDSEDGAASSARAK